MCDARNIGWVHVEGEPRENFLFTTDWLTAAVRAVRVEGRGPAWPEAVRSALARGIVRVGYSAEQVETALDKPLRRESEETAAGVVEVWIYPAQSITFTNGQVSAIRRIK